MEVEIPQQALGKALARGIATDSPAFFAEGKVRAKKIAKKYFKNFVKDLNFDKVDLFNGFRQFQHGFYGF